jgi:hypothetical protein
MLGICTHIIALVGSGGRIINRIFQVQQQGEHGSDY